jgi:hypothetical protein
MTQDWLWGLRTRPRIVHFAPVEKIVRGKALVVHIVKILSNWLL